MGIKLDLDYEGRPYLILTADVYGASKAYEDMLIEQFIRKAKRNGVFIKNESNFNTSDCYATIRINPTAGGKNE